MTDMELNEAVHQEAEGWELTPPTFTWKWARDRHYQNDVPDYCNDPAWCVAMMEKHKLPCRPFRPSVEPEDGWHVEYKPGCQMVAPSLTRAVALAVLQLTREGN